MTEFGPLWRTNGKGLGKFQLLLSNSKGFSKSATHSLLLTGCQQPQQGALYYPLASNTLRAVLFLNQAPWSSGEVLNALLLNGRHGINEMNNVHYYYLQSSPSSDLELVHNLSWSGTVLTDHDRLIIFWTSLRHRQDLASNGPALSDRPANRWTRLFV